MNSKIQELEKDRIEAINIIEGLLNEIDEFGGYGDLSILEKDMPNHPAIKAMHFLDKVKEKQ